MSLRSDQDWLQDIFNSADRIHKVIKLDHLGEFEDYVFDAIQYNLICIGEAVRQLSNDLKQSNPEIPWQLVTGMRNRLAHEYFQISRGQVESVILDHLVPFVDQCQQVKNQLANQTD